MQTTHFIKVYKQCFNHGTFIVKCLIVNTYSKSRESRYQCLLPLCDSGVIFEENYFIFLFREWLLLMIIGRNVSIIHCIYYYCVDDKAYLRGTADLMIKIATG